MKEVDPDVDVVGRDVRFQRAVANVDESLAPRPKRPILIFFRDSSQDQLISDACRMPAHT